MSYILIVKRFELYGFSAIQNKYYILYIYIYIYRYVKYTLDLRLPLDTTTYTKVSTHTNIGVSSQLAQWVMIWIVGVWSVSLQICIFFIMSSVDMIVW